MENYKLLQNTQNGDLQNVCRLSDRAGIPFDPANTDYQAYLAWIEEGNAPLGADTPLPTDNT
jgi:hypothetical protein